MIIFNKFYKVDPKDFIDHLAKVFDFKGLDDKKVKGQYFLKCPFHSNGQERTASANFSLVKKRHAEEGDFYCFGCHVKGHISSILVKLFGDKRLAEDWVEKNYGNKKALLEEKRTDFLKPIVLEEPVKEEIVVPQVFELPERAYRSKTSYYEKRGIPDELVEKFKLGFLDSEDESKRRVYLPVFNKEGQVVFFQTRKIHSKDFYLPLEAKKVLWGANEITGPEVVVCESIFNALTAWKNGFQSVAIFGSGDERVYEQLLELPCRSYLICLDNDKAGNTGAKVMAAVLKSKGKLVRRVLIDEPGKDLNDYAKLSHEDFMAKWYSWIRNI